MVLKWIGLIAPSAGSLFFAAECKTAVSVTSEADDGKKGEPFGPDPKGMIVFTNGGNFSLFQSKAEIPRIAANNRAKAVPEEALAIVASAIADCGTYTVSEVDKTILVKVNVSTLRTWPAGLNRSELSPLSQPMN